MLKLQPSAGEGEARQRAAIDDTTTTMPVRAASQCARRPPAPRATPRGRRQAPRRRPDMPAPDAARPLARACARTARVGAVGWLDRGSLSPAPRPPRPARRAARVQKDPAQEPKGKSGL